MSTTATRTGLLVFSVLLGLLEIVDGFRLELPWMAWAYALLLLGGSYWLWRSQSRGPVVMLGALHLLELLMLLLVFRTAEQAPPTALLVLFVVLSAGGTLTAAAVLMGRSHAVRA
ncbi:MAG: hypothetical protein ACXWDI_01735 [Nocardioides sp.]